MTKDICEAYCAGEAAAFFPDHFSDADARRQVIERVRRPLEPVVADAIERQNTRFAPSAARTRNLQLLRDGASAVVTGQQVGLFAGPLFNFYKAASAIRAAREMAAETGVPVVPVFWLQTEDHDLVEIASCQVPRAEGEDLCLSLRASNEGRVSLAHLYLPEAVEPLLESLRGELGGLAHAAEHLERLARHYRPGARWCDAFAAVVAEIFAGEGLVLVDPRADALAPIAAGLHRRAIEDAGPISEALVSRSDEIRAAGMKPAVHVREGAPLSFFHPEGPAGPRYRLAPGGDGWREVGGPRSHSAASVLAALEVEPLSCSTSVLLRPILQDTLLPTAAYVGGPGEVAYFAQLAPLYDALEMPMPIVVPRACFRLIEPKTQRLLDRLGVEASCSDLGEDELLSRATASRVSSSGDQIRRALVDSFATAIESCSKDLADAGSGMERAVEKTRGSVGQTVDRLVSKYEDGMRHRFQELVEAARKVRSLLHPNDVPQERYFGLSYFAARYGERRIVERMLAAVVPFSPKTRDLPCVEAE